MKSLIFLLAGVLLTFAQCNSPKNTEANVAPTQEISLKQQVENGALIVDVRSPQEFASGNYPGSVNIPLNEIASRIDEFKNQPSVIVYCRTGNRSGQAKNILEKNGIKKVTNGININHLKEEIQ